MEKITKEKGRESKTALLEKYVISAGVWISEARRKTKDYSYSFIELMWKARLNKFSCMYGTIYIIFVFLLILQHASFLYY